MTKMSSIKLIAATESCYKKQIHNKVHSTAEIGIIVHLMANACRSALYIKQKFQAPALMPAISGYVKDPLKIGLTTMQSRLHIKSAKSFRHKMYRLETELSKLLWKLEDKAQNPTIKWNIATTIQPYFQ